VHIFAQLNVTWLSECIVLAGSINAAEHNQWEFNSSDTRDVQISIKNIFISIQKQMTKTCYDKKIVWIIFEIAFVLKVLCCIFICFFLTLSLYEPAARGWVPRWNMELIRSQYEVKVKALNVWKQIYLLFYFQLRDFKILV